MVTQVACARCGSDDVMHELRDTFNPQRREQYGEWKVCQSCGFEAPVTRAECVECGRPQRDERGWQMQLTVDWETALYCPDCAEREFGSDGY